MWQPGGGLRRQTILKYYIPSARLMAAQLAVAPQSLDLVHFTPS